MKPFLNSSAFRRFASFIIAILVPIINHQFGLNLSPDVVYSVFGLAIVHILGEAHIDGKKATVAAVNAANSVLQSSTVINSGITITPVTLPPQMAYEDIFPTVQNVHDELKQMYAAVTSGKPNDAMTEAIKMYASINQFLIQYHAKSQAAPAQESKGA